MKKKTILNICHYVTKYLLIIFPIVVLCFSIIFGNTELFTECSTFMSTLYNLELNSFYSATINVLGLGSLNLNTYLGFVVYMPLWIFWVYMIDLLLDFMTFIPKIAHKWLSKGYGEE